MTKKELIDMSVIVQYPNFMKGGNYDISEKDIQEYKRDTTQILMPKGEPEDRFRGWNLNSHHFNNYYHANYSLPTLLDALLGIKFNIDNFEWVEEHENGFDISYLKPKKQYRFVVDAYNKHAEGGFEVLRPNIYITSDDMKGYAPTKYHMQYIGAHNCARIINLDANNNYKLYVSDDSHMIPVIPILACYFKEIVSVDYRYNNNRKRTKNLDFIYKNNNFTHCLIEISGANGARKYFESNFEPDFVSWLDNDKIFEYEDMPIVIGAEETIKTLDMITNPVDRKNAKKQAILNILRNN